MLARILASVVVIITGSDLAISRPPPPSPPDRVAAQSPVPASAPEDAATRKAREEKEAGWPATVKPVVSDWGPASNGLQIRLFLPDSVEANTNLTALVEFRASPTGPPREGVGLSAPHALKNAAIEITRVNSPSAPPGNEAPLRIECIDYAAIGPGPWMPLAPGPIELECGHRSHTRFQLALTDDGGVKPGEYRVVLDATSPDEPVRWWPNVTAPGAVLQPWTGHLRSGECSLNIAPEIERFEDVLLPKRLEVRSMTLPPATPGKSVTSAGTTLMRVTYSKDDAVPVHLRRRNGYSLCTHISNVAAQIDKNGDGQIDNNDYSPDETPGMIGGSSSRILQPGDDIDQWHRPITHPVKVTYKITIVETNEIRGHMGIAAKPGTTRTVWENTLTVEYAPPDAQK